MFQKFIIYDDEIIIGRVGLHKELLPKDSDPEKIFGGGLFTIDREKKNVHLYGKSEDFGHFDKEKAEILPFDRLYLKDFTRTIG
jgi:hypothetical protein